MEEIFLEDIEVRGVNVYEAAIAASKEARIINEIQKNSPEDDKRINPATLALRKLVEGRGRCIYPSRKDGVGDDE